MEITNYEGTDLLRVENFLQHHTNLEQKTVCTLLKTCNVSFVLEGINRWQSTMICELKDSYVQQSQRYVTLDNDGYSLPELKANTNILPTLPYLYSCGRFVHLHFSVQYPWHFVPSEQYPILVRYRLYFWGVFYAI